MEETGSQTSKEENPKLEISYQIPGPDFTTYQEKEFELELPHDSAQAAGNKKWFSSPCTISIEAGKKPPVEARALACRAFKRRFWSVTLRSDAKNKRPKRVKPYDYVVDSGLKKYIKRMTHRQPRVSTSKPYEDAKFKDFLGYCPPGHPKFSKLFGPQAEPSGTTDGKEKKEEEFLNDIHQICQTLDEILFPQESESTEPSGLIVVTGATDSSKSLITRGLIFLYLERAAQKARKARQRKPHLVTFEDPIERYYINDPQEKNGVPRTSEDLEELLDALYLDYTPREKDKDADNLQDVTHDALRQTPAVLFVGETREKSDWKALLEFAGSGHLVITTSHASSVVEAMSGIFRETDTKLPAQRSEIARRIMGLINLRSFTPPETTLRALLPAIWHRTPQSVNNLIADGLASILPTSGTGERDSEGGCYGRKFFAKKLIAKSKYAKNLERERKMRQTGSASKKESPDPLKAIEKKAIEWDLRGV